MSASRDFIRLFSKKHLSEIYLNEIRFKSAQGLDHIGNQAFEDRLTENLEIIYRKVHDRTYRFSQYREKLLSRGADKYPRVISIPTIRDKLTQKALAEVLRSTFGAKIPLLHSVLDEVISTYRAGLYTGVLRLDVKDFYPSIMHMFLFKEIRKKIKKGEILHLINNAISQQTVYRPDRNNKKLTNKGVPQGLSISNILANIYMSPLDNKYANISTIKYFRYVDDILVFCDIKDIKAVQDEITKDCEKLGLFLHSDKDNPSKALAGDLSNGFTYLGYSFDKLKVSVRKRSVDHLHESIIRLLTNYKYSKTHNIEFLKWGLNLRITGCIFNQSKYGWLFFFSQINDLTLLGSLDHFIKTQSKIFNVSKLKTKTFLKSYHEITRNLSKTTYIPNFDRLSVKDKHQILIQVFEYDNPRMSEKEIEYQFRNRIYKTVKELERDLARAS
jgi:RNA-directed DNA polymerase